MKIIFIVSIDNKKQSGLFNATHNRIKQFSRNNEIKVLNINSYDSIITTSIKRVLKKKILTRKKSFNHDNIKYEQLYLKVGILYYLLNRLNLQYYLYFFKTFKARKNFYNADLISAHSGSSNGLFAYWLKKILKKKIVVTYHGSDIHTLPSEDRGWHFALKKILSSSDGNIFVSNNLFQHAKSIGKVNNKKIIYNGVNTDIFHKLSKDWVEKTKYEKKLHGKIIGFVGILRNVKNADILPELFREISRKSDELVTFIVIGDGELRKSIEERFNEYKLNVLSTGRLISKEVAIYMNCMDLLVLPSKNEGFGMVLWEALSCGCQCIGSRVGGIPEAIGIENTVELNDSFIDNISDLAIEKITNKTIKNKIEVFTWEDTYKRELSFYNDIVSNG